MARLFTSRDSASYIQSIAVLEVSIDDNAERVVVFDRKTLKALCAGTVPTSKTAKFRLPLAYTTNFGLIVAILDDDGQYNIKAADGVRAEIRATPVDMSQ